MMGGMFTLVCDGGRCSKGSTSSGCWLSARKGGHKECLQVVPVHPNDRWLLGMQWEGALYIDKTLPFGLRSAPKLFTALADAAMWILRQEGINFVIHYGDDFLVIGAPDTQECAQALTTVKRVFRLHAWTTNRHGQVGRPSMVLNLSGD